MVPKNEKIVVKTGVEVTCATLIIDTKFFLHMDTPALKQVESLVTGGQSDSGHIMCSGCNSTHNHS